MVDESIEISRSQIFDKRVEESLSLSSIETFHKGVVNKLRKRILWKLNETSMKIDYSIVLSFFDAA